MRMCCLTFAACTIATLANAQNTPPEFDERGAVLCSYSLVTTLEAYARNCGQSGTENHMSLMGLLELHRGFVSRNGPATEDDLNAFEAQQTRPASTICDDQGVVEFYNAVEIQMSDFKDDIEESLSVDPEPVWNPCL